MTELSEGGRTALLEYADRGTPRGMDEILASASAPGVVVLEPRTTRRPVGWVLAAAAVLVAIVVGVVLASGSREESAPMETVDDSGVTTVPVTSTALVTLADLPEDLREGMEPVPPEARPEPVPEGWIPVGESFGGQQAMGYTRKVDQEAELDAYYEEGRLIATPLYDLPGGEVIGYTVRGLGIVEANRYHEHEAILLAEAQGNNAEREAASDQLDADAQQLLEDGGCSDIRECYEILGPPDVP